MKRCPECRRDYYDDSLLYCLDDGNALLDGPGSLDEPSTAILREPPAIAGDTTLPTHEVSEAPTAILQPSSTAGDSSATAAPRPSRRSLLAALLLLPIIVGAGFLVYRNTTSTKQIGSIAVMPFVNASGNPDIEYLSDGLTESLINSLSQVPELAVKARSSVFMYKGKDITPQQVAEDLSVEAVLNGRVVQRGEQLMLNLELVDAATGNQLWGEQYNRKSADLAGLQSEIARDVLTKLKSRLSGVDRAKFARNYTENTEAYHSYLRGRYHWNRRTRDDLKKSVEYFQHAIEKDPTYAMAYAGLAEAYILAPVYGAGNSRDYYPRSRSAALKAIEMDGALAEAHNVVATIMSNYDWKFSEAEAEWQKALALNPNYATSRQWYAEHLLYMGRFEEGLEQMKLAQELDPLSLIINAMLGVAYRVNGKYDKSDEQLRKTLDLDPNFPRTHLFLAELYQATEKYDEAIDEFGRLFVLTGVPQTQVEQFTASARNAYKAEGAKGYSRVMAETFTNNRERAAPPAPVLAAYWAGAGETEKAFEVLEDAYRDHDERLLTLKDPRMDRLKADPRYKDLVRRVGLPE